MADIPETPVRIDSNSKPFDLRMNFTLGPALPTPFLGVAEGGSTIPANANELSQLAAFTVTGGAQKISFGWTVDPLADEVFVEYWQTNFPANKSGIVCASGDSITTVSGVNYTAHGMKRLKYGRGAWNVGSFSTTQTGAATS